MREAARTLVGPTCDALERTSEALAQLLRDVTDPAPLAVGVWSIGETAAHVSGSGQACHDVLTGARAPERLDEVDSSNAAALAEDPERDLRVLADRLVRGDAALAAYGRAHVEDPDVEAFDGVIVPLSTVLGLELGELLVHGFDISRAAALPWRIDPQDAVLTLRAYLPLLPHNLDQSRAAGVHLALEIRIRGMPPVTLRIDDGTLVVEEVRGPVDAHIGAIPEAYLLQMWNRVPAWRLVLRGQLAVWGRRPWRALELGELMTT